jgi:hypothetical protein
MGVAFFCGNNLFKKSIKMAFFHTTRKKGKKKEDYIWGFLVWHHEHS